MAEAKWEWNKEAPPLGQRGVGPDTTAPMVRRYACWWTGARVLTVPAYVRSRCPQPRCLVRFGTRELKRYGTSLRAVARCGVAHPRLTPRQWPPWR